jgi:hypothetical protein
VVLGHYGLALAAKRFASRTSLGTLVLAAQLADEVWPILLLLGIERVEIRSASQPTLRLDFVSYPITHSLLTGIIGGIVLGLIYFILRRDFRGAIITALLVPSHWVLDLLVHTPDLPIWPGGPKVGFGLWHSLPATLILELLFFVGGLVIYLQSTTSKDKIGRYALWGFIILLVVGYASSLVGPPPKDVQGLAYSGLILWLLIPWAYWIDSHRLVREQLM